MRRSLGIISGAFALRSHAFARKNESKMGLVFAGRRTLPSVLFERAPGSRANGNWRLSNS
jgi:hypothetical protein